MQVLSTTGGTINFIAREKIVATKNYQLTLISENKNKGSEAASALNNLFL